MGKTPGVGRGSAVRTLLGQIASPPAASADQGDQEQNDKNKEQDLRDFSGACSDAKEAKSTRDYCNDQKDQGPAQHRFLF